MKPLLITAVLALTAPIASAGDFVFNLGIGKSRKGKSVRVGVGYHDSHHRGGHVNVAVRKHRDHRVHRAPRGHYDTVRRKVWVPGYYEKVYHPAEYAWRYDRCGRRIRVITQRAHYDRVWHPGHWEYRTVRVWHPTRGHRDGRHRRHR